MDFDPQHGKPLSAAWHGACDFDDGGVLQLHYCAAKLVAPQHAK